jgi:hypothetical protein
VTTTTIEQSAGTITVVTTVQIPAAQTFPLPIPALGEAFNTAEAVADLYAVD